MKYDDIIDLPRFEPKKHPRMSLRERAAQFAPYSALVGYGEAVSETVRAVDCVIELSPDERELLDRKTRILLERPDAEARVTFFIPDPKKDGGVYVTVAASVKGVDNVGRRLLLADGSNILLDNVLDIDGEIFSEYGI